MDEVNEDDGRSDLELNSYMIRFTPQDKYGPSEIKAFLESHFEKWIFAEEKSSNVHFHCMGSTIDSIEEVRSYIKHDILDVYYPKSERQRGFGNAQYNLSITDDFEKSSVYSIKNGVYWHSDNLSADYVNSLFNRSYKKFEAKEFMRKLEAIKEEFKLNRGISMEDFMIKFVQLKGEYRQPVKMSYIHEVALSNQVHRDPDSAKDIVGNYLKKIRYG